MRCRDRRDVDTSANGLISLYGKNGILRLVRLTVGARCSVSHLESCFALEAHIVLRSGEGVDRLSGRDARERTAVVREESGPQDPESFNAFTTPPVEPEGRKESKEERGAPIGAIAANATRSA